MSARDDLARIVNIGWGSDGEYEALDSTDYAIADAVLAAGYSKPRIVTTVDELEALPVGSVVRGVDEHFVFERYASDAVLGRNWWTSGEWSTYSADQITLPAYVLFTPEGEAK